MVRAGAADDVGWRPLRFALVGTPYSSSMMTFVALFAVFKLFGSPSFWVKQERPGVGASLSAPAWWEIRPAAERARLGARFIAPWPLHTTLKDVDLSFLLYTIILAILLSRRGFLQYRLQSNSHYTYYTCYTCYSFDRRGSSP